CPTPPGPPNGIHVPEAFLGVSNEAPFQAADYTEEEFFFSGTATAFERDPSYGYYQTELLRDGFIWVGVSVQSVGGNGSLLLGGNFGLKAWDPVRYGSLNVNPSDNYSYDIYS